MMGAIDNDNNTIKIYLPYYTHLDFLTASVKLDEGATLLRQDSTVINLLEDELEPIVVGDTVHYIVRSAEGQYRNYTLTQTVVPHSDPLSVLGYGNTEQMGGFNFKLHTLDDGIYPINANGLVYLFGNFYSSNTLGKFTLKDRNSEAVYHDYVRMVSVSPQEDNRYVMTARISPDVAYGDYDVSVEHQGRRTDLPPMSIKYKLSAGEYYSSSTAFAQGDTVVFTAENATYPKPERLFVRVDQSTNTVVPAGFSQEMYGKELEMKIISSSRTEIKAIFPDLVDGFYRGANTVNILAVFNREEGYEDNTPFHTEVQIAVPSAIGFTVLPRP